MMAQIMNAADAMSGSLASCYITIEDKRYNFMQLINFEAAISKTKSEVPILGKTGKGHKSNGWVGRFKGKAHYNQSVMRKLLERFKKNGEDIYFDIQIINEDSAGNAGKQIVILRECNLNGGVLTKFDADADYLEETIEGTFDDFEIKTGFSALSGMDD